MLDSIVPIGVLLGIALTASCQELEVAAIRPHAKHEPCRETRVLPGGTLFANCYTLDLIIREALNILPGQLDDGPKWVKEEQWDIAAKATGVSGTSDEEVYREMLQAIVRERFHAKIRTEERAAKGLIMVVARHGKLGPAIRLNTGAPHAFELKPGPSLFAQRVTMKELAEWLKLPAGNSRIVEDRTGLMGAYDFVLKWTPLQTEQLNKNASSQDVPTIFTALREQLGLTLRGDMVQETFYTLEDAKRPDAQ